MAMMQISIVPLGLQKTGVSDFIASALIPLKEEGIKFVVHDMGTTLYGETATLFRLAQQIHEHSFKNGAVRVLTNIALDDRRDKTVLANEKKDTVLNNLNSVKP